ncbi:MAG: hypothetical protein Q9219_004203 [cf. Caloplaca sp. 3 TL-2023]
MVPPPIVSPNIIREEVTLMPHQTPNPHRFSTSKQPPNQPSSQSRQLPTPQSSSSRQFASTPRFSFGSARQAPYSNSTSQQPSQFSPSVPRRPPHFQSRNLAAESDDIEEGRDQSGAEENLQDTLQPTNTAELIDSTTPPLPSTPTHKRRRIHHDVVSISSTSSPPSSPPQTAKPYPSSPQPLPSSQPSSPPPTHTARFILSPKASSHTTTTVPPRPSFTLPPRSPSPPPSLLTHPLFSPHRKGGPRYISGGMAATVRDWVVDVAASAPRRGNEWNIVMRLGDCRAPEEGGKMILVQAEIGEGGGDERWLLVGQGDGRGREVGRGAIVGVRTPVWDVEVRGERWRVGVDWGIVN